MTLNDVVDFDARDVFDFVGNYKIHEKMKEIYLDSLVYRLKGNAQNTLGKVEWKY